MNRQDQIRDNYETLLLSYAAGLLDMAQNFAVVVHLALNPRAREFVKDCEKIGGCLMEECQPAAMRNNALERCMSKLDSPPQQKTQHMCSNPKVRLPNEVRIPAHLLEHIACRPYQPRWRKSHPGLSMCELPLECRQSGVRFIKGAAGAKLQRHERRSPEITLVLDGAYADDTGLYQRGDLVMIDETAQRDPSACRQRGVIAMVVTSHPARFPGLAALLNSFIKF